ncbi:MAG: hypothetical protein KDC69_02940 [Flavobacteriaceae bacterium]|nr:hypothetical protein [Flavobacteriaceae bacterium]
MSAKKTLLFLLFLYCIFINQDFYAQENVGKSNGEQVPVTLFSSTFDTSLLTDKETVFYHPVLFEKYKFLEVTPNYGLNSYNLRINLKNFGRNPTIDDLMDNYKKNELIKPLQFQYNLWNTIPHKGAGKDLIQQPKN